MAPHSILVIDDSPDSLAIYQELLSIDGYRVHAVATVNKARQALRQHRPTVVVIDDDPEGIHAVILAAQLEQDALSQSERIPTFIAIRGDISWGDDLQLSHIEHVLTKPLDFARFDQLLHASVASWLLHSST